MDATAPFADASLESTDAARIVIQASQPFVGRWNRLVTTTNWEKGRIICQWRDALLAASAPAAECSDEAWARLVGGVTGQHAGRLRRVWKRFGESFQNFPDLFWSHFHAAVEWDDAEMWLEGAVHSKWSVSEMRRMRWQTTGGDDAARPREEDIVVGELDEDFEPALKQSPDATEPHSGAQKSERGESEHDFQSGPSSEGPDFGDEPPFDGHSDLAAESLLGTSGTSPGPKTAQEQPFSVLPEIPEDLYDAIESVKVAILRHKGEKWAQTSRENVVAWIDALRRMTLLDES